MKHLLLIGLFFVGMSTVAFGQQCSERNPGGSCTYLDKSGKRVNGMCLGNSCVQKPN